MPTDAAAPPTAASPSAIVEAVRRELCSRAEAALAKYGENSADNPLPPHEWLTRAYEETLDLALYLMSAEEEMLRLLAGRTARGGGR